MGLFAILKSRVVFTLKIFMVETFCDHKSKSLVQSKMNISKSDAVLIHMQQLAQVKYLTADVFRHILY